MGRPARSTPTARDDTAADRSDEQRFLDDGATPQEPSKDPEAPEADAVEQARPVETPPGRGNPASGIEVPEADAIEQATGAPVDPDED